MIYTPIACGLHDELQLRALRGGPVRIVWEEGPGGAVHTRQVVDSITDVFSRSGVEYLRTGGGVEIRLDLLVEVDGIAFGGGAC